MSGSFADSNALLYFASKDARKAAVSEMLLAEGLTISVQVLNECANVFRKKWTLGWDATEYFLDLIMGRTTVTSVTVETHDLGLHMAQRHRLSVYDGMIVASALIAGCDRLYSEDMHDGLRVEGQLRIINPFKR